MSTLTERTAETDAPILDVLAERWSTRIFDRGSAAHATVLASLAGFNSAWAGDAAALVVFVAETTRDGEPLRWAQYDTGQVAAHFTVQAHANGLSTHQMGGFDHDAISAGFGLGPEFTPVTVMAVGELGDSRACAGPSPRRSS